MDQKYDIGIVGGGLAGLALSIQLAKAGHSVILFEKEAYPFHKVCGEYISNESWDFLLSLGLDLPGINHSKITDLQITTRSGKALNQKLPLGGFGISRYRLDTELSKIATNAGVRIRANTKVNDIIFKDEGFTIDAGKDSAFVKVAAASFGKRSNLDVKWKRPFATASKNKLNNYVGIKYHVLADLPNDLIALHLFEGGYCGIVKIEDDKYNLCYLTTADNLQKSKNDVKEMEASILSQNPHLEKLFSNSRKCSDTPVTISQISFDDKSQVEEHVLMIGDAAGMITPLCGNGMSMALHASKIAAKQIDLFLLDKISRTAMEKSYSLEWKKEFAARLRFGRRIQRLFGTPWLLSSVMRIGVIFPSTISWLIRKTHGKPF